VRSWLGGDGWSVYKEEVGGDVYMGTSGLWNDWKKNHSEFLHILNHQQSHHDSTKSNLSEVFNNSMRCARPHISHSSPFSLPLFFLHLVNQSCSSPSLSL
jgi:hypothetical protein